MRSSGQGTGEVSPRYQLVWGGQGRPPEVSDRPENDTPFGPRKFWPTPHTTIVRLIPMFLTTRLLFSRAELTNERSEKS